MQSLNMLFYKAHPKGLSTKFRVMHSEDPLEVPNPHQDQSQELKFVDMYEDTDYVVTLSPILLPIKSYMKMMENLKMSWRMMMVMMKLIYS